MNIPPVSTPAYAQDPGPIGAVQRHDRAVAEAADAAERELAAPAPTPPPAAPPSESDSPTKTGVHLDARV